MKPDENKFIDDNLGLVFSVMKQLNLSYNEEAQSIGMEALLKAYRNFDPERGYAQSTVAVVYIKNALYGYWNTIKSQSLKNRITESYDAAIAYGEEYESNMTKLGILATESLEHEYFFNDCSVLEIHIARAIRETSNERHKEVIQAWADSKFEKSLKQLGIEYGMSTSMVSSIMANFKFRLRVKLKEAGYGDYS